MHQRGKEKNISVVNLGNQTVERKNKCLSSELNFIL